MEARAEIYVQRAKEFEIMATNAESEILKRTYYELARGYLTLAMFAPKGSASSAK